MFRPSIVSECFHHAPFVCLQVKTSQEVSLRPKTPGPALPGVFICCLRFGNHKAAAIKLKVPCIRTHTTQAITPDTSPQDDFEVVAIRAKCRIEPAYPVRYIKKAHWAGMLQEVSPWVNDFVKEWRTNHPKKRPSNKKIMTNKKPRAPQKVSKGSKSAAESSEDEEVDWPGYECDGCGLEDLNGTIFSCSRCNKKPFDLVRPFFFPVCFLFA